MIKLVFCLAFVSMVLGKEYPGFDSFGSGKYFVSKKRANFGGAWSGCQVNGWTLAIENSFDDTQALNEALTKSKGFVVGSAYYFGAYEFASDFDPTWIWLQTGDLMHYTNWVDIPPHVGKHCVVKTTDGKVFGKWKEVGCLEEHQYICQKKK